MEIPRTIGDRRHRLLVTSVTWVAYIAGFSWLYPLFTTHTGVFAFIPLLVTAWNCGSAAGALGGLAAAGATVALGWLTAGISPSGWMSVPGMLGTVVFIGTGYAVGRMRDLDTLRQAEVTERLRTESRLREQGGRLALVNEITRKIRNDESVESIVRAVVDGIGEYFPDFDTSYATADLGGFHAVCTRRRSGELDTTRRRFESPVSQDDLDWLRSCDLLAIDDVSAGNHAGLKETQIPADVRTYLSAPIPHGDGIIGLLAIHRPTPHGWSEHEKATVRDAAEVLAVALEDASRRQQLRDSEEKFRILAENSQVHISLTGKEGLVYTNRAMQHITGYTEAELRSLDFMDLVAPEHRELAREIAQRRFAGETLDTPHELKLVDKDGREHWIEFIGRTINLGGKPTLLTSAVETTARKQAEELLLESESRLRSVLDQLADGVAVTADDQLVYVNPTLCRMLGYEAQELLQADPLGLLETDASPDRRLGRAQTSGGPSGGEAVELEALRGDGSRIPVEVVTRQIVYSGSPARLTTVRDLTRRKQAEQAVREQEQRMELLLDQHPDGVMLIVDGKIAYANSAICQISGRDAEELIGQDPLATVTPGDYDRAVARLRLNEATQGQQPIPTEYRSFRRDGSTIPVEVVASPSIQYRGSTAVFVTIRDLTERHRAEQAVRDAEAKYRSLFEQAPIGIVVANPDSTFAQVNRAFCEMLGYTTDELVGRSFVDITHKDDIGDTPAWAARVLEKATSIIRFQKRYLRKDGSTVQAETTVSVVRDDGGSVLYALAMIEDVTERRLLEHQLEQIQRIESVGQLAGGVAHNFNNALTAIYGYSELLERRFDPEDPAHKDLEQIKRVAEQSASLTRQLLAFSRKEQVRPSVFPLNDLVVETRDMLAPILGDHIELVSRLDETAALVHCDRGQMEQVVTNLLINARDAMPNAGTLTVETCDATVTDAFALSHPDARPGRYVKLTVIDTGVGMDDETLNRVFEPFFTTKEQGKGVGLGLAMVHGAVTQSGGFVTAASTLGVGSSFSVYLPKHRDLETQPSRASATTTTTR